MPNQEGLWMGNYNISVIHEDDRKRIAELDRLLKREGIKRDSHLDYTIGLFDSDCNMIATGSSYLNTLRCVAVDEEHQGEGLLGVILTHLLQHLAERGITHAFIYTKRDNVDFFHGLGFSEIDSGMDLVAFMENRRNGFSSYLDGLASHRREGVSAAIVMNCNPFTLGHRYLVETASRQNDFTHIFVVSEDASLFPCADRFELVAAGVSDLRNVELHPTGSYIISSAVFPSYFIEDTESVIRAQAHLDINIFKKIASSLGVTRRYSGTEPFSRVTGIYNEVMRRELPSAGIEFVEVPRAENEGNPISASHVRAMIKAGDLESARALVPQSTYDYFLTEKGRETIRKIKEADHVIHY
jgi:[citrate (pro-3S)-lyase] ligase